MSHTFSVSIESLIGAAFILMVLPALFLITRGIVRKIRAKAKVLREREEEKERDDKPKEAALFESFPAAWRLAYDECMESGDFRTRKAWLDRFITLHGPALPSLSIQFARKFAEMVAEDPKDSDFCHALGILNSWVGLKGDYPAYDPTRSVQEQYNRDGSPVAEEKVTKLSDDETKLFFPFPWRDAYVTVCGLDTYTAGREWFKIWLAAQDRRRLAKITPHAVELLLHEIVDSEDDSKENWHIEEMLVKSLRRYMHVGDFEGNDWHLEEKLPADWYHFYVELMGCPDTRGLWKEKIGWMSPDADKHPCTKTPLNVEQARLLAKALSGGEEFAMESYAHDLRTFIKMESEAICEATSNSATSDHASSDHASLTENEMRALLDG